MQNFDESNGLVNLGKERSTRKLDKRASGQLYILINTTTMINNAIDDYDVWASKLSTVQYIKYLSLFVHPLLSTVCTIPFEYVRKSDSYGQHTHISV